VGTHRQHSPLRVGCALLLLALLPPIVTAQDATRDLPPATEPGGARGYASPPDQAGKDAALFLPRVLLLPFRIATHVATAPLRVTAGAISSSGLIERMGRGFRDDRYFIPTFFVDPDPGLNVGFRAGHGNPFHQGSCITYRAAWGGSEDQVYALTLRDRRPESVGWHYRLTAKYEIRSRQSYFGLGNISTYVYRTFYTNERYVFLGKLGYKPEPWMSWDLAVGIHRDQPSPATDLDPGEWSLERRFHSEFMAPGWRIDPQNVWGEIALSLDRRNHPAHPTEGWSAEGFCGYAYGTGADNLDYVRYGGEGHAYVPLGGSRVLALRLAGEEARTSENRPIKFTELVSLGGPSSLRGYVEDRFRENAAVLATVEYRYRIAPFAEACFFADFGKVMPRLLDFQFLAVHRSWGLGLRMFSDDRFLFRMQGAISDECWALFATLEPAFYRNDRRDRR